MPQSRGPNLYTLLIGHGDLSKTSRRSKYADRTSFDKRVTKYSECVLFFPPGIRVHSSGIFANKGTAEDTGSLGAVGPRAE